METVFAMVGLALLVVVAGVHYWLIGALGRREGSESSMAALRAYLGGRSPGLRHMRVTDRERSLIRWVWMISWTAMAATILIFLFFMEP